MTNFPARPHLREFLEPSKIPLSTKEQGIHSTHGPVGDITQSNHISYIIKANVNIFVLQSRSKFTNVPACGYSVPCRKENKKDYFQGMEKTGRGNRHETGKRVEN